MRGKRRRWRAAGLLLIVALVLLAQPALVAVRTLLLLPAVFPGDAVNPLAALTPAPRHEEYAFEYAAGTVAADMYHPAQGGKHGAVILLLGARPVPRQDPLVVQLAEALARDGLVVLVPESSSLVAGRILPEETDALVKSFDLVSSQPDVDASRIGLLGFSVGGALSLVAVAQPPLRGQVRFVNVLGAYEDATRLLVDVASQSQVVDGQAQPWTPSPLAQQVMAEQLVDTLPDADQTPLERAYVDGGAPLSADEVAALSAAGRTMLPLLSGTSRGEAEAAVARLGPGTQARLADVSPSTYLSSVTTALYVMDDQDDTYIPPTESQALVAAAPPGVVRRWTQFSIFAHVIPDRPVPWQTFLPDLWALYWHLDAVLGEAL